MIEFFPKRYQVYGPRRGTVDDLLWIVDHAHSDLHESADKMTFHVSMVVTSNDSEENLEFDDLRFDSVRARLQEKPKGLLYALIRSPVAAIWSDIAPGADINNSRSGVSAEIALPAEARDLLRRLAPHDVEVSNGDLADVATFVSDFTAQRKYKPARDYAKALQHA
jgi:hypothetical protein